MSNGMWSLPISNKIFFTFFLSIMTIAIGLGFLNYYERTGFSPQKTVRYYCGDEEGAVDEPLSARRKQGKAGGRTSLPKILSGTFGGNPHPHFLYPHRRFYTLPYPCNDAFARGIKDHDLRRLFYGYYPESGAPWLIRYVCHHFVITFTISNILLLLSFGAYIFIPLYEMWFRRDHDGLAD